jgi:hypothetical protein
MGRENANKRREKREVRKEKKEHKVAKEVWSVSDANKFFFSDANCGLSPEWKR